MRKRSKKFDVVVVGELNPDLVLSGNVLPEFGQVEKLVDQASLVIGSSSAIFACGAARLGLKVAFVGKVGRDLFGQFMRQSLDEHGVDTRGVLEPRDVPTGVSVILAQGGDRAILTYPGTIPLLTYAEIDQDILAQARHLHLGSYYIQEQLRPDVPRLFAGARDLGLSISLDTNYDPHNRWDGGVEPLLSLVDIFLPNEVEACAIAQEPSLDRAIARLRTQTKYLAVKRGEKGATLCAGMRKCEVKPLQLDVVDTVGAGDSFDAGFVYAFLAGWDGDKMLRMANICGSLSTRKAGGTAAQPTLEEALRYL